jgi:hypothetical protein
VDFQVLINPEPLYMAKKATDEMSAAVFLLEMERWRLFFGYGLLATL